MAWVGRAWLGSGVLVYAGVVGDAVAHVHAAHQVVVCDDSGAEVSVEMDGARIGPARRVLVPGGTRHRLMPETAETRAMSVYLDVDTAIGRTIGAVAENVPAADWSTACRAVTSTWPIGPNPTGSDDELYALAGHLQRRGPTDGTDDVHVYVRRALDVVGAGMSGHVTLADVACRTGVSASHLSRLWRADLKLSFNSWVRWERLRIAARAIGDGASITEAAHTAGFADGAHASRVCREMFGLSPTELAAGVTVI